MTSKEFRDKIKSGQLEITKSGKIKKGEMTPEWEQYLKTKDMTVTEYRKNSKSHGASKGSKKKTNTLKGKHAVRNSDARQDALKKGFRSAFEQHISEQLIKYKMTFGYETIKLKYEIKPTVECTCQKCGSKDIMETHPYTPDFVFEHFIIEAKGYFSPKDRRKMVAVKKAYPNLVILIVFQSNKKLSSKSKTTYLKWARREGFIACEYKNMMSHIITINRAV